MERKAMRGTNDAPSCFLSSDMRWKRSERCEFEADDCKCSELDDMGRICIGLLKR